MFVPNSARFFREGASWGAGIKSRTDADGVLVRSHEIVVKVVQRAQTVERHGRVAVLGATVIV